MPFIPDIASKNVLTNYSGTLAAGDLLLVPEARTVAVAGGPPQGLTHLEFRLLQALMAQADKTVPAERLLRQLWGGSEPADRQHLRQLVYRLRHKIEADPAAPRYLLATPGRGLPPGRQRWLRSPGPPDRRRGW